jgi:hypothetical protein
VVETVLVVETTARMLFFYSPDILERLANAQTFSVAPHPFKQLYTIPVPFKDVNRHCSNTTEQSEVVVVLVELLYPSP